MVGRMATTIQISENLRRELKALASYQDLSYNELLEDLMDVFEASIPFRTEKEFAAWFEDNLDKFGFEEVVERRKRSSPDYRVQTADGETQEVEIELIARHFIAHGHDPDETDQIVALFSDRDEIDGVPVVSVISKDALKDEVIETREHQYTSISVPRGLADDIEAFIEDTGFQNTSEFTKFLLRDIVSHGDIENDEYMKDGVKRIRERLKNLGYLPEDVGADPDKHRTDEDM